MKPGAKRKEIDYLRSENFVPRTSVIESMHSASCGKDYFFHWWAVERIGKLGESSVDGGVLQASLVRMRLLHELT